MKGDLLQDISGMKGDRKAYPEGAYSLPHQSNIPFSQPHQTTGKAESTYVLYSVRQI